MTDPETSRTIIEVEQSKPIQLFVSTLGVVAITRATRHLTFEEYLMEDTEDLEERRELIDGELVELPPESGPNLSIANYLFLKLVEIGISLKLIHPHACEVQVPVIQPKDAQNRYPDLVVLKEEHLPLIQRRATITLKMPPPALVCL